MRRRRERGKKKITEEGKRKRSRRIEVKVI